MHIFKGNSVGQGSKKNLLVDTEDFLFLNVALSTVINFD